MKIRLHKFLASSRVDGPENRACIFVQGCPIRCKGCAVPWTWEEDCGELIEVESLIEAIKNGPKIEGVTFLGGEPFEQATALSIIGTELKKVNLSIVTFTGYEIEKLKNSNRKDWLDLLGATDLLIDGPFIRELAENKRPWVGSANQKYHFLTPRLKYIEEKLLDIPNRLEVRLLPDGMVSVNGLIVTDDLKKFVESLIN